MPLGLFGKLPQKRDFVSFGVAPEILAPLEAWLHAAIAASRAELGRSWEEHYLVSPIWRFWIGPLVFGTGCAGVIMPSVDGVGRYFPLLAIYACAEGERMTPPPFAPQGDWFSAMEQRLLSTLDGEAVVQPESLLMGLPGPATESAAARAEAQNSFKGGRFWTGEVRSSLAALLTGVVEADYREAAKVRSFWWTGGGEAGRPVLYTKEGLPDPYFYTRMVKSVSDLAI